MDVREKRPSYAVLGIGEYWRFDETGTHHGTRLAGNRLVDDEYEPVPVEAMVNGNLQGYSEALKLKLYLRWTDGELSFYDPVTNTPIPSLESERARADASEAWAELEREGHLVAEARMRELEDRLRRGEG